MRKILTGAVILASVATGCGGSDIADRPDDAVRVVVTTNMLGDIVIGALGDMVGADVDVEVIMPVGADTHDFAASARQAEAMENADLVVVNGIGAEAGMTDIIANVRDGGASVFTVGDAVGDLVLPGDPHVWLDPDAMAVAVAALADALVESTPLDPATVERNTTAYIDRLRELDDTISTILDAVPTDRRVLVTNHDSLAYFARRYGFRVSGTVISSVSTSAEASAADLQALAALIRAEGLPTIFVETSESDRLARAVADDVGGIDLVPLYTGSLGPEGSGATSYLDAMTVNAERIAAALR